MTDKKYDSGAGPTAAEFHELAVEVRALKVCITSFVTKYGPYLDEKLQGHTSWLSLRRDLMRALVISGGIAFSAGVLGLVVLVGREWLKGWLK